MLGFWAFKREKKSVFFLTVVLSTVTLFLWHKHNFHYLLLKIYNKYCTSDPVYAMIMHFFYKQCQHKKPCAYQDWAPNCSLLKDRYGTENKFAICCGRCWTEQPRDGPCAGENVLPGENPPHRQVQYPDLRLCRWLIFLQYFKRHCALRELAKMQDPYSESGSWTRRVKMTHKSRKKLRNFMFWSAGCSLLRAEGFFCNLDVLYGGLGIGCHQTPGSWSISNEYGFDTLPKWTGICLCW